jgi:phosphoribosyl-AMP cyclohydrolase
LSFPRHSRLGGNDGNLDYYKIPASAGMTGAAMDLIEKLNFDDKGLIPAVIQDEKSSKVLTLCYMNKEALEKTLEEKKIYVFRRSKKKTMLKGETSGCVQQVKSMYVDCAANSLLFKVEQTRAACHEGYFTCYYQKVNEHGKVVIEEKRVFDPKDVYK